MQRNLKKKIIFLLPTLLIALSFLFFQVTSVHADEEGNKLRELEDKIAEYEAKISESKSKQKTLANTIDVLNNQIYLTTVRINKTTQDMTVLEEEVKELGTKIETLDQSLNDVSELLQIRVEETYKKSFLPTFSIIFTSNGFSDFLSRFEYLKSVQQHDKELMFDMEETKLNFDKQKILKESKQEELQVLEETLKNQSMQLGNQKYSKEHLLNLTKNDEREFQKLLQSAKSEFEAIQAIIAQRGNEAKVGPVKKGDVIASIISGKSCNSNGTHLHFTVVDQNNNTLNPFSKLKPIDHQNCSGPGECGEGDPFNPSGDWDWPLKPSIRFMQGYGSTWAVRNTWVGQIYSFHNGIDIRGSSTTVYAVADGELSRGSYSGSGGCALRYVRLDHKDSNISTLYLHVNY